MDKPSAYRNCPSKIPVISNKYVLAQVPQKDIEMEILRLDHPIPTAIPMRYNSSLREMYQSSMASRRSPRVYNRKLILPMTDRIQIQDMDALEGFGDVPRHNDSIGHRNLMINTENTGDITDQSMLAQEMNLDTIAKMMESHRFKSTDSSTYMSNFDLEEESIYNTTSMNSFLANPSPLYEGDKMPLKGSSVSCGQLSPSENEFYDFNEGSLDDILRDIKIGVGNRTASASDDLIDNEVPEFTSLYSASEKNSETSEKNVRDTPSPLPDTTADKESPASDEAKREDKETLSINLGALRCKDDNDAANNGE